VILVMDADTAGQNSALRSAGIFLAAELSVKAAALPAGEDPDSLIVKRGGAAMQEILDKAKSFIDFQIDVLSKRHDRSTEAGLKRIADEVVAYVSHAPSQVFQDSLLNQASARLGGEFSLHKLRALMTKAPRGPHEPAVEINAPTAAPPPLEERSLIHLLMHHPEAMSLAQRYLPGVYLTDADCRFLYDRLLAGSATAPDLAQIAREKGDRCLNLVAELAAEDQRLSGDELPWQRAAQEIILALRRRALERKRRELTQARDQAAEGSRTPLDAQIAEVVLDLGLLRQGWDKALPLLELDAQG
jgi:DNA primase